MTLYKDNATEPLDAEVASVSQSARPEWQKALDLLWSRAVLLARVTALGTLLALLVAFLLPRRYTSTISLMPPSRQMPAGMMAAVGELANNPQVGNYASELLGAKSTGSMFVGVLQSRVVADALIDKFDLRRVYGDKYYYQARRQLAKNTGVSEDRKSGIISVNVTDRDRARAQALANEYVTQLNHQVAALNTSDAHQERVFLESRLALYKADVDKAAAELGEYSSSHATFGLKEQATAELTGAATLQGQVIVAESELQGLRQVYGEQNYRVKAGEARVSELRLQLKKATGQDMNAPDADAYPSLRELPVLGIRYQELLRNATVAETIFVTLQKRLELAKVEEAREVPAVQVLDPADLPEKYSWPPRSVIALSGFVLSFGLCALFIWADERLKRSGGMWSFVRSGSSYFT